MHLVIVTTELATAGCSPGGLGSFSANLARIFQKNGHRVTILLVTTKEKEVVFDEEIDLQKVYVEKVLWDKFAHMAENISAFVGEDRIILRRIFVNLYKGELVKALIDEINQKEKIDIIHTCNLSQSSLGLDGSIPYVLRISSYMRMCINANLPEIREEYYDESTFTLEDKLDIYLLQKSRYIISPSEMLAKIGREKIGITPTVIESPFVLNRDRWDDGIYCQLVKGKKYIIHYGQMSYIKGTHIVAKIVRKVLECNPDIYMLLAGLSEEMKDDRGQTLMAHELVIQCAGKYKNRVIYAGCLLREQLYPLIDNSEFCLLPSRLENFANACVEAMAMGKIVIGTAGASFEQLIENEKNGFLCERDKEESYLRAVEAVLSMDEDAKKQMEIEASEQVKRLEPDVMYQKYNDFYKKVIREWSV